MPSGFYKKSSSLFPHASGESIFCKNLDRPKPYTDIAYETGTTEMTDDA
jgi:hypothetical protein